MSFSEAKSGRNPKWSRDELIIALDLYLKHRERLPSLHSEAIMDVSRLLNELAGALRQKYKNFRNANSVYMKLENFRGIDPVYIKQGKKGLPQGAKGDRVVWDDFVERPKELSQVAAAIKSNIEAGALDIDNIEPESIVEAQEGRVLTRVHTIRERDSKIVARKKQLVLRNTGTLSCEACEFDYSKVYGERGRGFIEVHHLKPVSTLFPGEKTRLQDLALLCASCHRMIHTKNPWLSLDELKFLLK